MRDAILYGGEECGNIRNSSELDLTGGRTLWPGENDCHHCSTFS